MRSKNSNVKCIHRARCLWLFSQFAAPKFENLVRRVLFLYFIIIVAPAVGQMGSIHALDLELEVATPEQIGLHLPVNRTISMNSKVSVRYRKSGDAKWLTAHPLLRIHPEWNDPSAPKKPVDAFAGSIFDLTPGTRYEVEVTLHEPDQRDKVYVLTSATRGLPAKSTKATKTASPGSDLKSMLNALVPGDVLELSEGIYNIDGLSIDRAGTASQPIHVSRRLTQRRRPERYQWYGTGTRKYIPSHY